MSEKEYGQEERGSDVISDSGGEDGKASFRASEGSGDRD